MKYILTKEKQIFVYALTNSSSPLIKSVVFGNVCSIRNKVLIEMC